MENRGYQFEGAEASFELLMEREHLGRTPEFAEMLHREFPRFAAEWPEGVSRRGFLHLAAAADEERAGI